MVFGVLAFSRISNRTDSTIQVADSVDAERFKHCDLRNFLRPIREKIAER